MSKDWMWIVIAAVIGSCAYSDLYIKPEVYKKAYTEGFTEGFTNGVQSRINYEQGK